MKTEDVENLNRLANAWLSVQHALGETIDVTTPRKGKRELFMEVRDSQKAIEEALIGLCYEVING